MEENILVVIFMAGGFFILWVLYGIYRNTIGSPYKQLKKKHDKSNIKEVVYTLVSTDRGIVIASLDNIVIKQHRYRYETLDDENSFLNVDFSINREANKIDNYFGNTHRYKTTTGYDLKQNRINYIENLELYEVHIPIVYNCEKLVAIAVLQMDRDALAIHLALEKEVEISIKRKVYEAEDGMIIYSRVLYDCEFYFAFLQSDVKYYNIYFSTYILPNEKE